MAKAKSRADRWTEAATKAREALDALAAHLEGAQPLKEAAEAALSDLTSVQDEYGEWLGNLPENLSSSDLASRLEEVTNITIPDEVDLADLSEAFDALDEADNADLPKGFGR